MGLVSSTVTRELLAEVVTRTGGPLCVPVLMRYDTADPYAIRAVFQSGDGHEVPWILGRELLTLGVHRATGEGDVRVWPSSCADQTVLCVVLSSPDGEALVQFAANDVVDFLCSTYSLCPRGKERDHLDMDNALRALIASRP